MTAPGSKIAFLFNHEAVHQVTHTAPVISELAALDAGVRISVLSSSDAQEQAVRRLLANAVTERVTFTRLAIGPAAAALDRVARHVAPFRRLAVLKENLALFATFDALAVPETTSALLKTRYGLKGPKLIYLPHGAGDRSIGFQEVTRAFDLVLLSGPKVRDRMLAAGLIREGGYAMVGYPKFDAVDLDDRLRLFGDERPVVLYNPHFDPKLSSWYDHGIAILDWFAAQVRFNLVFAPHVMLFRRQVHSSVEHRRMRRRRDVPDRFRSASNILIDLGSDRSVDMSYTRSCDIYLGDVSSQVYEWIARPRPCIFINSHQARWRGRSDYAHWTLGEVIDGIAGLPAALEHATGTPGAYREPQSRAFAETFSIEPEPSSRRAAQAILDYLGATVAPAPDAKKPPNL